MTPRGCPYLCTSDAPDLKQGGSHHDQTSEAYSQPDHPQARRGDDLADHRRRFSAVSRARAERAEARLAKARQVIEICQLDDAAPQGPARFRARRADPATSARRLRDDADSTTRLEYRPSRRKRPNVAVADSVVVLVEERELVKNSIRALEAATVRGRHGNRGSRSDGWRVPRNHAAGRDQGRTERHQSSQVEPVLLGVLKRRQRNANLALSMRLVLSRYSVTLDSVTLAAHTAVPPDAVW